MDYLTLLPKDILNIVEEYKEPQITVNANNGEYDFTIATNQLDYVFKLKDWCSSKSQETKRFFNQEGGRLHFKQDAAQIPIEFINKEKLTSYAHAGFTFYSTLRTKLLMALADITKYNYQPKTYLENPTPTIVELERSLYHGEDIYIETNQLGIDISVDLIPSVLERFLKKVRNNRDAELNTGMNPIIVIKNNVLSIVLDSYNTVILKEDLKVALLGVLEKYSNRYQNL